MYLRNADNESLEGLITTEIYRALSNTSNVVQDIDKELLAFEGDDAKVTYCNSKSLDFINKLKISSDDIDDSEKRQAVSFLRKVDGVSADDFQYFMDLQSKCFVRDEIGDSFYDKSAIDDVKSLIRNYKPGEPIIIEKIIKVNNLTQKENNFYIEKIENFKRNMKFAIKSYLYKNIASLVRREQYPKRTPEVLSIREERIKKENLKLNDIIKNGLNLRYHSFELNDSVKKTWDYSLLTDLKNSLKIKGFIENTKASDFKKIFTGKEITKKICWLTNPSDLAYFIQKLQKVKVKKTGKVPGKSFFLIKDTKQKHWEITARCFVKKDGTPFSSKELSGLKKPANSKIIDKCLTALK